MSGGMNNRQKISDDDQNWLPIRYVRYIMYVIYYIIYIIKLGETYLKKFKTHRLSL